MSAVVADTHVAVWYLSDISQLSVDALAALRGARQAGEPIYVSTISLVEVAYLVDKGRLDESIFQLLKDNLADPNFELTPVSLDMEIAEKVRQIPRSIVADMPDRIVAATALHLGLPLVTRDQKIQALSIKTIW